MLIINSLLPDLRSLAALIWLTQHGYIERNPVERLESFAATPKSQRRLLTDDEVSAILAVAPPARALTYRLMLATGLRVGEVRRIMVKNLSVDMGALTLEPMQTKNKKAATIFIPPWLLDELQKAAIGKGP